MAGTLLSLPGFCSFPVNRRTTTALWGQTVAGRDKFRGHHT
jgi:hypothetical protein